MELCESNPCGGRGNPLSGIHEPSPSRRFHHNDLASSSKGEGREGSKMTIVGTVCINLKGEKNMYDRQIVEKSDIAWKRFNESYVKSSGEICKRMKRRIVKLLILSLIGYNSK